MLPTDRKSKVLANLPLGIALLLYACTLANGTDHLDDEAVTGTWKVVSAELRGEPMEVAPERYVVFTEGKATFIADGAPTVIFAARFDSSKDPPHIDTSLSSNSVRQSGIYLVDGDVMKWCLSSDDEKRPTDFTTDPSSNRSLRILKRWDAAKTKAMPVCNQ